MRRIKISDIPNGLKLKALLFYPGLSYSFNLLNSMINFFTNRKRFKKKGIIKETYFLSKLRVSVYKSKNEKEDKGIVLFLHGGGFTLFHPEEDEKAFFIPFLNFGYTIVSPDYREGNRNPYPASLDDALLTFNWIENKFKDKVIYLSGFSAGATIALQLIIKNKLNIKKSILFSPVLSREKSKMITPLLNNKNLNEALNNYLGKNKQAELALPIFYKENKLIPTLISSGSLEPTVEQISVFINNNKSVNWNLNINLYHGYQILYPNSKEWEKEFNDALYFLEK